MEITNAGVETTARIIRTQRAIFTEAASRASIVSKQRLGIEATLQVMQSVNASWSGMRALKTILGHFGIHLNFASEVNGSSSIPKPSHSLNLMHLRRNIFCRNKGENETTRCLDWLSLRYCAWTLKLADADTPPEQPAAQDTHPDEPERQKRLGQHRARRQ